MSYSQVQNSAVRLSTSVFKCDSAINYTLVTTMQQPSTNTLYEHKSGNGSFSESCFSTKDRKQSASHRSTCVTSMTLLGNSCNIQIYLLTQLLWSLLCFVMRKELSRWHRRDPHEYLSHFRAVADVPTQWCHQQNVICAHTIKSCVGFLYFFDFILYIPLWLRIVCAAKFLWCRLHFFAPPYSCTSFYIYDLFLGTV